MFGLKEKGKPIPVTRCGGSVGFETSKLPHFLDNWFKYGGGVVNLTRLQPLLPKRFRVLISAIY
jgi:hypothetical protein